MTTDTRSLGIASTVKKTFSRQTSVATEINASPSAIWTLLTDASSYPRWNSTIVSIDGRIALGETIRLISTLDPKRTFKLKVKEFESEKKLVWGDAIGKRTYDLKKIANGRTLFSMSETIGGPSFPLFAIIIPSFDNAFEVFASDLTKEAERSSRS